MHSVKYVFVLFFLRLNQLTLASADKSSFNSNGDGKKARPLSPETSSVLSTVTAAVAAKTPTIDEEKNDMMRAGLLSKVFDHISLLVEDWFVGVRPRTSVIPCPFCSEDISRELAELRRSFSDNPLLLTAEEKAERGLPLEEEEQQTTPVCTSIHCVYCVAKFNYRVIIIP